MPSASAFLAGSGEGAAPAGMGARDFLTGASAPPAVDTPPVDASEEPSLGRRIAAGAVRVVPPLAAGLLTASPFAAAGAGALSEAGAQAIEGRRNVPQVVLQGALSAIPGFGLAEEASPLVRTAVRGLEGAAIGGGGTAASSLLEGKGVSAKDFLLGAGIGALAGGAGGQLEGRAVSQATTRRVGGAAAGALEEGLRPLGHAADRTAARGARELAVGQETEALEGLGSPVHIPAEPTPLRQEGLHGQVTGDVAQRAKAHVERLAQESTHEPTKIISRHVAEGIARGDIELDPRLLNRWGITPEQFAEDYVKTYSEWGRTGQQLSSLKRSMNQAARNDPQIAAALKKLGVDVDMTSHQFRRFWRTLDDTRRAMLVGQVATSVRNGLSQGARYNVEMFEIGLETLLKTGSPRQALRDAAEFQASFLRAAQPWHIGQLESILNAKPVEGLRLFQTPAAEATLGQNARRAVNALNELQEQFYRRALFDAHLRNGLRARGLEHLLENPGQIPEDLIRHAVDRALQGTFAENPQSKLGKGFLEAWRSGRPLFTLIQPFPRFYANALKFLFQYNPSGLLRLATPAGRAAAPEVISKAMVGTSMLAGALAMREKWGGEKWYEIKVGDKRIDTRAFAPFSQYLFLAEALRQALAQKNRGESIDPHKWTLSAQDWTQAFLSINRVAGTAASILDMVVGRGSFDNFPDLIADLAGQYLGGFTVPFGTFKDAVASTSPEEARLRETRHRLSGNAGEDLLSLTGPARANVPFASQTLPEKPQLYASGPLTTEYPATRQATGLSIQTRGPVQAEVNRLGVDFREVAPRTGIPLADRELTRRIGPIIEKAGPKLLASPMYREAADDVKRLILTSGIGGDKGLFLVAKQMAMRDLKKTRPKLALAVALRGRDKDLRDMLETRGVIPTERQLLQGEGDQP